MDSMQANSFQLSKKGEKNPPIYNEINKILMEWNPIGVDESVLNTEYASYIAEIVETISDFDKLVKQLEDILINKIGLAYNPMDTEHKKDLLNFAQKMYDVGQNV